MKKQLLFQFIILSMLTFFTACSNDDGEGTTPPTLEEVQANIIGKWESDEMTLEFNTSTVQIIHGPIECSTPDGYLCIAKRNDTEPYTIKKGENLVTICVGYQDHDHMYIHMLKDDILKIEFYEKGAFFTLAKTIQEEIEEIKEKCLECSGSGSIIDDCYGCGGLGIQWNFHKCPECNDKGEDLIVGNTCWNCQGKAYFEEKIICQECKGNSVAQMITCPMCDGKGTRN